MQVTQATRYRQGHPILRGRGLGHLLEEKEGKVNDRNEDIKKVRVVERKKDIQIILCHVLGRGRDRLGEGIDASVDVCLWDPFVVFASSFSVF